MKRSIKRLGITLAVVAFGWNSIAAARADDLLRGAGGTESLDRWLAYHQEPIQNMTDVWQLEDGVLTCTGLPRGYLYTKQKYTNFVLRLQWRWPPTGKPGKGGVLFRMTGEHKVWPKCLEAQLNQGDEGDFVGIGGFRFEGPADRFRKVQHPQFGEIRFLTKMQSLAKPPGQWNDLEITARGQTVTQRLNGKLVNQSSGCDEVAGPILLTAENDPIQFRNIELTPADR